MDFVIAQVGGPALFASGGVQRNQLLVLVTLAHYVERVAHNRGAGITQAALVETPNLFGATFRPLLQQTRFGGQAIAVRAQPLRPIITKRNNRRQDREE